MRRYRHLNSSDINIIRFCSINAQIMRTFHHAQHVLQVLIPHHHQNTCEEAKPLFGPISVIFDPAMDVKSA